MRVRLLVAAMAAGLVLTACGGSGDDASAAGATDPSPGADLFDFTAPDVRGGEVVGADYAGQDLVIWFWAPW